MGKYQLIGGNQMKFKINNGSIKQEEEVIELEQLLASLELMGEEPLQSRSIYLFEEIERHVAIKISRQIDLINQLDDELELVEKDYVREPINIFIDTYGGYVSAGSSIITAIKRSKTEVNGIVTGNCYSMGVPILLACDNRYATSLSTFMIHSVSVELIQSTSLTGYKHSLESTEMLQEIIKGFFKRELDGKSQFYDDIVDGTKDVYFDSYKAKEYGIVHEVDYEYKKDEPKPILENKKTDVIKKKPLCRKWKTKTNK